MARAVDGETEGCDGLAPQGVSTTMSAPHLVQKQLEQICQGPRIFTSSPVEEEVIFFLEIASSRVKDLHLSNLYFLMMLRLPKWLGMAKDQTSIFLSA